MVRNSTGRKITDLGMEGIETHGVDVVAAWRDGSDGLSLAARVGCAVS